MENLVELKSEDIAPIEGGIILMPRFVLAIADFINGFGDAFDSGYNDARDSNPF